MISARPGSGVSKEELDMQTPLPKEDRMTVPRRGGAPTAEQELEQLLQLQRELPERIQRAKERVERKRERAARASARDDTRIAKLLQKHLLEQARKNPAAADWMTERLRESGVPEAQIALLLSAKDAPEE
jgi:hypothetical protein